MEALLQYSANKPNKIDFVNSPLINSDPSIGPGTEKAKLRRHDSDNTTCAVTRIRTWVVSATTRSTNHYTITAILQLSVLNSYHHSKHQPSLIFAEHKKNCAPTTSGPCHLRA